MKLWISLECDDEEAYELHHSKPKWKADGSFPEKWRSEDGHCGLSCYNLDRFGFVPLPKVDECCEYELSGSKPVLLCTYRQGIAKKEHCIAKKRCNEEVERLRKAARMALAVLDPYTYDPDYKGGFQAKKVADTKHALRKALGKEEK
jgi:hypothetical protein